MCSVFVHIGTSHLLPRLLGKGVKEIEGRLRPESMGDRKARCPAGP